MAAACALCGPLVAACSSDASSEGDDTGNEAVTDTPESGVRDQTDTGNCWLFATAGWMESLEYAAMIEKGTARADDPATRPPHFSPAYWDYWDWYAKITGGKIKGRDAEAIKELLDAGGSWGTAVEIASAYGMARTHNFLGDEAHVEASRVLVALATLAKSLATGALKNTSARRDRALVRKELDRAFALTSDVVDALTQAFGDGSKTLTTGASANAVVVSPSNVDVRLPRRDGAPVIVPLGNAIGRRAAGDDPDRRTGPDAWSVADYDATTPAARREYFRRIQRALHENVPLPISWYVASNGEDGDTGKFRSIPARPADAAASSGHETLLDDYEVDNVPGFGRLAAGVPATKEAEAAALDESARIVFLRVKNSWGEKITADGPAGYNDLFFEYLTGTLRVCPAGVAATSKKCTDEVPLQDVALPAGY